MAHAASLVAHGALAAGAGDAAAHRRRPGRAARSACSPSASGARPARPASRRSAHRRRAAGRDDERGARRARARSSATSCTRAPRRSRRRRAGRRRPPRVVDEVERGGERRGAPRACGSRRSPPRRPRAARVRILLVSQFWPSAGRPGLRRLRRADRRASSSARGHTVDRAVDRPPRRRARGRRAAAARRACGSRAGAGPTSIFAHFLVPAGARRGGRVARRARAARRHGPRPGRARTRSAARAVRARDRVRRAPRAHGHLQLGVPARPLAAARPRRSEIIDCGVDLERFAAPTRRGPRGARARGRRRPVLLFAGSLIERKNVVRLRDAFERLGRGTLVVVGDGPLRARARGPRRASASPAASRTTTVPRCMAAADVVVPAEPATSRSARSCSRRWRASAPSSRRTSAARREFVTPEAGALVDPLTTSSRSAPASSTRAVAAHARTRRRARRPRPSTTSAVRSARMEGCCAAASVSAAARELGVEREALGDRRHALGQLGASARRSPASAPWR